jgi:hypothetical protein
MSEALGIVTTRITDFDANPKKVVVGETVTIRGKLEWHLWPCIWNPLEGKPIEIIADGGKIGETSTTAGGWFDFIWKPMAAGKYYVKASFPGDIVYSPSVSRTVEVEVITPEEKQREEMVFWSLVAVGIAAAIGIGVAVYQHYETERYISLALAR